MGRGQGVHPVLNLANIGIHPHQGKTDPARHLRNAQRHGSGRRNIARGSTALGRIVNRKAYHRDWQHPGQRHQPEPECGRYDAEIQRLAPIHIHRPDRRLVLERIMGEQFDGAHVTDRINNRARDLRPRTRPRLGPHPDFWHVMLDEPEITDHPDAQHDGNPPVNRDDKDQRGNDRRYRKHHGIQEFGHHIGQCPRRLHLFLRNPAREIIVKKRDRLPQRPAVQP